MKGIVIKSVYSNKYMFDIVEFTKEYSNSNRKTYRYIIRRKRKYGLIRWWHKIWESAVCGEQNKSAYILNANKAIKKFIEETNG